MVVGDLSCGRLRPMTESDAGPVVQRLMFGEAARSLRLAAGVELADADRRLDRYRGRLSKIENGNLAPSPGEVDIMIEMYRVGGREAEELRAMGTEARRRASPERIQGSSRQYAKLEQSAAEIFMVYNEIPGVLQTFEYARAQLSRSPVVAAGEVDVLARGRVDRGERVLRERGPKIASLIGEEAILREVGGRSVLCDQLSHLRRLADNQKISVRIIPHAAGAVAALSVPFTILYLGDDRWIVYVESLTRVDYIKSSTQYRAAFDLAAGVAADEAGSKAMLDRRISDLS